MILPGREEDEADERGTSAKDSVGKQEMDRVKLRRVGLGLEEKKASRIFKDEAQRRGSLCDTIALGQIQSKHLDPGKKEKALPETFNRHPKERREGEPFVKVNEYWNEGSEPIAQCPAATQRKPKENHPLTVKKGERKSLNFHLDV